MWCHVACSHVTITWPCVTVHLHIRTSLYTCFHYFFGIPILNFFFCYMLSSVCAVQALHHQWLVNMLLPCKVLVLLEESQHRWVASWHSTKLPTEDPFQPINFMKSEAVNTSLLQPVHILHPLFTCTPLSIASTLYSLSPKFTLHSIQPIDKLTLPPSP